ncbi:MAG: hypothetical protein D6771_02990, partial [Zetaproteobacteria bacterium]
MKAGVRALFLGFRLLFTEPSIRRLLWGYLAAIVVLMLLAGWGGYLLVMHGLAGVGEGEGFWAAVLAFGETLLAWAAGIAAAVAGYFVFAPLIAGPWLEGVARAA